jgi:hypothetical protein
VGWQRASVVPQGVGGATGEVAEGVGGVGGEVPFCGAVGGVGGVGGVGEEVPFSGGLSVESVGLAAGVGEVDGEVPFRGVSVGPSVSVGGYRWGWRRGGVVQQGVGGLSVRLAAGVGGVGSGEVRFRGVSVELLVGLAPDVAGVGGKVPFRRGSVRLPVRWQRVSVGGWQRRVSFHRGAVRPSLGVSGCCRWRWQRGVGGAVS